MTETIWLWIIRRSEGEWGGCDNLLFFSSVDQAVLEFQEQDQFELYYELLDEDGDQIDVDYATVDLMARTLPDCMDNGTVIPETIRRQLRS